MTAGMMPPTRGAIQPHGGEPTIELFLVLKREAYAEPGRWARRRLPSGTVVSLRIPTAARLGHVRRQLAIIASWAPTTMTEKMRWEEEVRRIQVAFGGAKWERGDDLFSPEGAIAAVFAVETAR